MITKEQYLEAIEICKKYREQLREELEKSDFIGKEENHYTDETILEETAISFRLLNLLFIYLERKDYALKKSNITIAHVKKIPLKELMKERRFGKKAKAEFKDLLSKIH